MRLYLETTMFNYYFDVERDGHVDVVRLFESVRDGKHEAFTSDYTVLELQVHQPLENEDIDGKNQSCGRIWNCRHMHGKGGS
ncbi:hypothetical protein AGMMS50276_12820 [Synergistales bacterium]|nr:hypothetical protein AGMMS50276_12820 [Synergistales bacterium]